MYDTVLLPRERVTSCVLPASIVRLLCVYCASIVCLLFRSREARVPEQRFCGARRVAFTLCHHVCTSHWTRSMPSVRPNKRMRCKTPPPPPSSRPAVVGVALGSEGDSSSKRQVYLVTMPHPREARSSCGVSLVAPEHFDMCKVMAARHGKRFLI